VTTLHETSAVVIYGKDPIGEDHVWPSGGDTTVLNAGTGSTTFNGTETSNNYTSYGPYSAQQILSASDAIVVNSGGGALDTMASFTLEFLFHWDSSTNPTAYFFGKGGNFWIKYTKASPGNLILHRRCGSGWVTGSEEWTFPIGVLTNGGTYHLQVQWGPNGDATPIVKLNTVAKSNSNHSGRGFLVGSSWSDDGGSQPRVMNADASSGIKGSVTVFRLHNTLLSDAYLQDNYTLDWARLWATVNVNPGTPPGVTVAAKKMSMASAGSPSSGQATITLTDTTWLETTTHVEVIDGVTPATKYEEGTILSIVPNTSITLTGNLSQSYTTPTVSRVSDLAYHWYEGVIANANAAAIKPLADVLHSIPVAGNITVAIRNPLTAAARYVDVPPIPKHTLRSKVPNKFILTTSVEEEQQ
jgi:hypothetical protein